MGMRPVYCGRVGALCSEVKGVKNIPVVYTIILADRSSLSH
jgi:hypothetical protein